jgi:hypothetical protein
MNHDDLTDFESALRALRPRKPGPLPERRWSQPPVWLAVAAALLVAVTVLRTRFGEAPPPAVRPDPPALATADPASAVRLSALRRHAGDPAALLAALDAQSDRVLRPVGGERIAILQRGD